MSPAASRHSTATAVPVAVWVPGTAPSPEPSTGRSGRPDNATSANATSRTTISAAAAETTAIPTNVAQSMFTDALPSGGGRVGGQVVGRIGGGRSRQVVDVAGVHHVAARRDVDARGEGDPAHPDDDHADRTGRGQPRGGRTHQRGRRQGEAPRQRDPPRHSPVHARQLATGPR